MMTAVNPFMGKYRICEYYPAIISLNNDSNILKMLAARVCVSNKIWKYTILFMFLYQMSTDILFIFIDILISSSKIKLCGSSGSPFSSNKFLVPVGKVVLTVSVSSSLYLSDVIICDEEFLSQN